MSDSKKLRRKNYTAAEMQAHWRAGQSEIGELPAVAHPRCRERASHDPAYFLRHYFPDAYARKFSAAHLQYINDVEDIARHEGRKIIVLPRGCGKTTVAVGLAARLLLFGLRRYVVMVAATESAAKRLCDDLSQMLISQAILDDFPECLCFSMLGGRPQRAASQTLNGKPTNVRMSSDIIVFPTLGNASDGATVEIMAITGNIRGRHRMTASGEMLRPDMVFIDDPQTAESAKSEMQVLERKKIIESDILGLAGHDKSVATICAATVICEDDLAEKLLARPDWRGQRVPIVDGWGGDSCAAAWKEYDLARLKVLEGESKPGTENATYKKHQKTIARHVVPMDDGLKSRTEVDAIQHARNKFIELGEFAFMAEMMNRPKSERPAVPYRFVYGDVLKRMNGRGRGEVPADIVSVAAAIDVNRYSLAWSVVALDTAEEYSVIDYGWYVPPGKKQVWEDDENKEIAIAAALHDLAGIILHHSSYSEEVSTLVIDAGFSAEIVYGVCSNLARTERPRRIYAARGLPADKYFPPRSRRGVYGRGDGCDIRRTQSAGGNVFYWDSHYGHMTEQQAWLLPPGVPGALTVFGRDVDVHREFALQVAADRLTKTIPLGDGRLLCTWTVDRHNEQSDTVSMCISALSIGRGTVRRLSVGFRRDSAAYRAPAKSQEKKKSEEIAESQEKKKSEEVAESQEKKTSKPRKVRRRMGGSWLTNW